MGCGAAQLTARPRLDVVLVDRGLAASRERARALILAGQVRVNGQIVSKAGTPIAADALVELVVPDHPYVGRGGVKLAHALDTFAIDPAGRRALDVGASTGGFTDVLLRRGAASVRGERARADGRRRAPQRDDCDDRRVVHLAAPHPARAAAVPRARR
jgi:hypothetical protein